MSIPNVTPNKTKILEGKLGVFIGAENAAQAAHTFLGCTTEDGVTRLVETETRQVKCNEQFGKLRTVLMEIGVRISFTLQELADTLDNMAMGQLGASVDGDVLTLTRTVNPISLSLVTWKDQAETKSRIHYFKSVEPSVDMVLDFKIKEDVVQPMEFWTQDVGPTEVTITDEA